MSWIRLDGLILAESSNMAMTCVRTSKKSLGSLVPFRFSRVCMNVFGKGTKLVLFTKTISFAFLLILVKNCVIVVDPFQRSRETKTSASQSDILLRLVCSKQNHPHQLENSYNSWVGYFTFPTILINEFNRYVNFSSPSSIFIKNNCFLCLSINKPPNPLYPYLKFSWKQWIEQLHRNIKQKETSHQSFVSFLE